MDLTLGQRQRGARLGDALARLVHRVDAVAELGLRLLDLALGLRHPPLQRFDRRAAGLVGRLGLVVLAPRHEIALEQASDSLELPARLAVGALGAADVGAHRIGRGSARLEPRARLVDGRLGRLHADHRHLQRCPRLLDLRVRTLAGQGHFGARRA